MGLSPAPLGRLVYALVLVGAIGLPEKALGFIVPTEREFRGWPIWCQALHVGSLAGSQGEFVGRVDPDLVAKYYNELHGYWHYCAGMIWLNRARANADPKQGAWEYEQAIAETLFNYTRSSPKHHLRGAMGTTLGVAYRGLKKPEKALEYLQKAIAEQPSYAPAYSVMSMVLRDAGNLEGARDVLVRGNEATRGESAEIHYLLGLTYLDLNDVPAARRHADEAYRRGYPLPGLRDRLQRAVQP